MNSSEKSFINTEWVTNLVRSLVVLEAEDLSKWLDTNHVTVEDAQWLINQGLAPYVYYRLRQFGLLERLPDKTHYFLNQSYYAASLREAVQFGEATTMVLQALAQAEVESILMKGMALAHTVYPNSRCRLMSDLDLWILPEQYKKAILALGEIGYYPKDTDAFAFVDGVQIMVSERHGAGPLELQWPAIRSVWVQLATQIDHDAIWERRIPFSLGGQPTHIMTSEDILFHLCIHHAINHYFSSPWLRNLLDIHLVAELPLLAWDQIEKRAQAWHIRTVIWTALHLAQHFFGTPIPEKTLTALSPSYLKVKTIGRLNLEEDTLQMRSNHLPHRRLLILSLLVDRPQDVLGLVWHTIFPRKEWLQVHYNADSSEALRRARFLHPFRFFLSERFLGQEPVG